MKGIGKAVIVFAVIGCGVGLTLPHPSDAKVDSCSSYINAVKSANARYFGPAFPYHYALGQLRQESACRSKVTAFDGGMGIAQFMPKTSKYIQSLMGEALDPYNPEHAVKMQAFYMARIHKKENWSKKLFISYQIYNGGAGSLKKEFVLAGSVVDWCKMKKVCKRKVITLKSGRLLDFCEVNYDYPVKVEKYAKQYKKQPDAMAFW